MLTTERNVFACPHNQVLRAILLLYPELLGFADLGMKAIYKFDMGDMPVIVAVVAAETSVHITGPSEWQKRIATGTFNSEKI